MAGIDDIVACPVKKLFGAVRAWDVISIMRMQRRPLPALRARRPVLYGTAAAFVLLLAVAAYLAQTAPVSVGARPVAAAPPPAASAPAPAPVSEPSAQPRLVQGRVLDFDTGVPLRGTSIWAGADELVADAEGRFSLKTVPGQPAAVIVKRPVEHCEAI